MSRGNLLEERIETRPSAPRLDDGDHDRFAHYADKKDLERAIFDGVPLVALCGKKWLPTRDPERYPVCPECRRIYETLEDA